jgi:hypothetical protein
VALRVTPQWQLRQVLDRRRRPCRLSARTPLHQAGRERAVTGCAGAVVWIAGGDWRLLASLPLAEKRLASLPQADVQGLPDGGFPRPRGGSRRPCGVVPSAGAGNSADGGGRGSACEKYRMPDARGRSGSAKLLILKGQKWCRRRDSNPHGFPHTPLKRACLPIPPLRRRKVKHGF